MTVAEPSIGIFTTDRDLVVKVWDDWLVRATGIAKDEARGQFLTRLCPSIETRGLLRRFQRVLDEGVVEVLAPAFHHYLIPCAPSPASKYFEHMQQRVTIAPLREEDLIVGLIASIEDVTARLDRERELAEQLASSDEGTRLEATRALAAGETHDASSPLVGAIGDESWRVRRAAVEGLARNDGPELAAALLRLLREEHRNFSILSSALQLLALSKREMVEPLIELLRDDDADLRLQAALALGEQRDPSAISALIEALDDEDPNLRFHAIEALGKLQATEAVDLLVGIAETRDFFLSFPALDALVQINDSRIAPRLIALLSDELLRAPAANALGHLGDEEAVTPLAALLNESGTPIEAAVSALVAIYDRYQRLYGEGAHIADLARLAINASGAQMLLDRLSSAETDELRVLARVLGWLEGGAVERALTWLLGKPDVRKEVVESLINYGPRVVDLLLEQIEAEDFETRQAAVIALGRIGDRRATLALAGLLTGDTELTVAAAGALAKIGDRRAFEPLLSLLGHPNAAARQAVISALNSLGHPELPFRIAVFLNDPDPRVRESAVKIAGYFGYPECADQLLERASDADENVRRATIEHLPYLEDARIVQTIIHALQKETPRVRASAAQALAYLNSAVALPHLLTALDDSDPWVRYFAARSIGRHSDANLEIEILEILTRLARTDAANQVRIAAAGALGHLDNPRAIEILGQLAEDNNQDLARAALKALGQIKTPDAFSHLRQALHSGDAGRRTEAVRALALHDAPEAISELEWVAAADQDPAVVQESINGLQQLARKKSPEATAAIDALISLTASTLRREAAISALSHLPAEQIDLVAQGLKQAKVEVRRALIEALGRMKQLRASAWLSAALDDDDASVRLAAATALGHLGNRNAEQKLMLIARSDPDSAVRRAAYLALYRQGIQD